MLVDDNRGLIVRLQRVIVSSLSVVIASFFFLHHPVEEVLYRTFNWILKCSEVELCTDAIDSLALSTSGSSLFPLIHS